MRDPRDALIGSLLESIVAIGRPLAAERRHPFGAITVSATQLHALFVLAHGPEQMTSGGLAEALRVTPAAVTQLVDTLQRRGLVERVENPADARSKFVQLTDAVRVDIGEFEAEVTARSRWRFDALTDAELEELNRLLEKVEVRG